MVKRTKVLIKGSISSGAFKNSLMGTLKNCSFSNFKFAYYSCTHHLKIILSCSNTCMPFNFLNFYAILYMDLSRKLPIGIQDFKKLRKNGCIYVDKSEFIYNLSQVQSPYFLSRPSRFGKSLLLSTMEYYFLGEKELFKGLAIESLEKTGRNTLCSKSVSGRTIIPI